jgi:hypothetical protein
VVEVDVLLSTDEADGHSTAALDEIAGGLLDDHELASGTLADERIGDALFPESGETFGSRGESNRLQLGNAGSS